MNNEQANPAALGPVVRRVDDRTATPVNGASANGTNDGTAHRKPRADSPNVFAFLHNALRGRYVFVIIAGVLTAAAAAAAAWKYTHPIFASDGLVRIAFSMPVVLKETDQNQNLPETFMASQKMLITSRRVMDAAVQDPVWKAYGRSVPQFPDQYFGAHLKVDVNTHSELIQITVDDPDPVTAAAAVTSIVNAYSDLFTATDKQLERQRNGLLSDQQTQDEARIADLKQDLREKAREFGTTKLDPFFDGAVTRVTRLEAALNEIQLALMAGPTAATRPTTRQAADAAAELTPEYIAMKDPNMRLFLNEQQKQQAELSELLVKFPPTRPEVVAVKEGLELAKAHVASYLQQYIVYNAATAQNLADGPLNPVATAGMSPEQLKTHAALLTTTLADAKKEMIDLGMKRFDIEEDEFKLTALQAEQTELADRMEALRTEGSLGGRLTIISAGEVPLSPIIDRRMKLAAAAGAFGLLLPAGLALLISLIQRRYRYADETTKGSALNNVPLLGMLPEVGRKLDPEIMHATALGIHQMRVLLCANTPREEKRSYLITSATEGEGKTNLTVALGMSYAAAKRRTLLIDGDFVGRRLSRGFKAEGSEGFFEAMREGRIGDRVRQESPLLYILPTGNVSSTDAWSITADAIRTILDQTREQFDTVLIDTGPILGSLEAALLAQEVDGVLLTISRGQHPALVEHALRRLSSVRAKVVGAVFNRAKLGDFHGSAYISSHSSSPAPGNFAVDRAQVPGNFSDFGPLVRAVSMGSPAPAAA